MPSVRVRVTLPPSLDEEVIAYKGMTEAQTGPLPNAALAEAPGARGPCGTRKCMTSIETGQRHDPMSAYAF